MSKLLDPMTTTAWLFAGVDVSKDRLDVCLRWNEPESHHKEEAFFVAYDETAGSTPCSLASWRSVSC